MASQFGTLKGGWSNELESLEKLMRVFEELGGEQEDEIHDLVAVTRQFVREGDVMVREAPFATSRKEKHHLYLFNDLLIMGRPCIDDNSSNGRKYKLTHFVILRQCTFKDQPKPDQDGHFVETLTQVSRHRVHADGTLATDQHDPHARIVTRIEKLELSFASQQQRQEFMQEIYQFLDEVEREMIARKDSAQELDEKAGVAPVKQRSWAAKKRVGTLTKKSLAQGDSSDTASEVSSTDSVGGFSLADIEARYQVNLKTPHNDQEHHKVEFEICFGDGPMGFSLGSAPGVGVLIGRLAAHSFAETGGVCIGDRIVRIENDPVGLDVAWQDVVDKLKKHARPVTITFERSSARQINHDEDQHAGAEEEPAQDTTMTVSSSTTTGSEPAPLPKQRSWANRRAQNAAGSQGGHGGVSNLGDLEKVYSKAEQTGGSKSKDELALKAFATVQLGNDAEKTSAAVLKEILVSEMSYVADLRCLVGEYILPLRRTARREKCRDMDGASAICEHNMIRQTCQRTSSEASPLMDADDMKAIFCNTETLMTVNTELLHQLQYGLIKLGERPQGKPPQLKDLAAVYAPAFHQIMPFFKMYSVYCHQYHVAIERLLACRSDSQELNQFLTDKEQKSQFNSLSSLLIKPIQRICKYPLLFSTLIHEMGKAPGMAEYIAELKSAADTIEAIAQSVNKQVGESEAMEDLLAAFDELGGAKGAPGLVEAHRKFVRTEDVLYHSAAQDKEGEYHEKMLYLFNDLLVVAKSTHTGSGTTLIHKLSSSNSLYRGKISGAGGGSSILRHLSTARNTLTKKSSAGGGGAGGGAGSTAGQIAKIELWLDISTLTPVAMEMKDAATAGDAKKFGVNIKHISRKTEEAPKRATLSLKRSTVSSSSTGTTAGNASGKIITVVERFEVWFFEEDKRDDFLRDLHKQIDRQEELQTGQKKAQNTVGTPKTQRSWTRKTNRHDSAAGGVGHGRTSSAGNALSEIEGKYSKLSG